MSIRTCDTADKITELEIAAGRVTEEKPLPDQALKLNNSRGMLQGGLGLFDRYSFPCVK